MRTDEKITWLKKFTQFIGLEKSTVSNAEKLTATLGGGISIILISLISYHFTGAEGTALIVPSMGASAVLLFAVPHGALSQPWALVGGNLVAAIVGVACALLIPNTYLAAGCAVGLAIGMMHLLRCIHPPGGATALVAVIGGTAISEMGWWFVITPILLNVLIILLVAIIFNSFFPWRRYPVSLMMQTTAPPNAALVEGIRNYQPDIDPVYIEKAMREMDLMVDISSRDLKQLIELTLKYANQPHFIPEQIQLGRYYTNGQHNEQWAIRQIIDERRSDNPDQDMVIYRVVDGRGLRSTDSCRRDEFARWAKQEVHPYRD